MPLTGVELLSVRNGGAGEIIATMKAVGNESPDNYVGQQIRESFSLPRAFGRYLQDSDLRPELASQHRGSARYVLERLTAGRAGTFTVGELGRFEDYHGGTGFLHLDDIDWFTPAALRRGIGFYIEQTYRYRGDTVGRFRVIRVVHSRTRVQLHKERMGTS